MSAVFFKDSLLPFFQKSGLHLSFQQFNKSTTTVVNCQAALLWRECELWEMPVACERTGSDGWQIWEAALSPTYVRVPSPTSTLSYFLSSVPWSCRGWAYLKIAPPPEDQSWITHVQISELLLFFPHSHSGIVGKVSSVSVFFYHDRIFYGLPAVLFRLACLSQLSTVEKDTDIETYKKKKYTHTLFSSEQSSSRGRLLWGTDLNCSGWTEHSWQRAVCLSADRSISPGW